MNSIELQQRRQFLQQASAIAVSSALTSRLAVGDDTKAAVPTADGFVRGKDKRLIVHNAKVGEIETPLTLLREKGLLAAAQA